MSKMNDLQDRIARFENMATADPTNDMAHFSLGSAYFDADRFAEAVTSFEVCIKLNPDMTRAMELTGAALIKLGKTEEAKIHLLKGYEQAAGRGERRVQDAIAEILNDASIEIPSVESASSNAPTGKPLEEAPLPGAIGQWILEHVDADTWNAWIGQGTKVINELRLDFSNKEDQQSYEGYMVEFLGIPNDIVAQDKTES
jgi:Fe-S cluster biosynthesis and repair protein YggX